MHEQSANNAARNRELRNSTVETAVFQARQQGFLSLFAPRLHLNPALIIIFRQL